MNSRSSVLRSFIKTVLLSCIGLSACSHPLSRKLEGRWLGESVENFADGEIAVATGWARGTSFEFSGSKLTVAVPAEEPRTGNYKVESAREGHVVLAVASPEGRVQKARLSLEDEHLLRWHLDDSRSVILRREQ
jgi:hypothetical protein